MRILEIGCGEKRVFNNSICIDIRKTSEVDIIADAGKLPFHNESFEHIFSSHMIEHISHLEINDILKNWVRLLKIGGKLELRCPDLRARSLFLFFSPSKKNVENIYGSQNYEGNYHKSGYTYGLLKNILINIGLVRIRRVVDGHRFLNFVLKDLHVIGIKKNSSKILK